MRSTILGTVELHVEIQQVVSGNGYTISAAMFNSAFGTSLSVDQEREVLGMDGDQEVGK